MRVSSSGLHCSTPSRSPRCSRSAGSGPCQFLAAPPSGRGPPWQRLPTASPAGGAKPCVPRVPRNPLYMGLAVVCLGLTLALDTWWGIILLALVLIVMHRGVIQREERYLERKFGDGYRQYRAAVARDL